MTSFEQDFPRTQASRFRAQKEVAALAPVVDLSVARVHRALRRATNLGGGPVASERIDAILRYLDEPSEEQWDEIKSIYLAPQTTAWKAALAHTDYDVRNGPKTRMVDEGFPPFREPRFERDGRWAAIPEPGQISDAIIATITGTVTAGTRTPHT